MFVGHYGIALALRRAEPRLSLGTLFLSVQLVDLLWGAAILLGWERARIVPGYTAASPLEFLQYPITHSLLAAVVWGAVAAAFHASWPSVTRRQLRTTLLVGLAVFSHYWLDVVVHVPDLPLAGGDSPRLGLGLWRSVPGTLVAELGLLAAGAALYLRTGTPRHPVRRRRLALLLGLVAAAWLIGVFGPPPPNITAVAVVAIVGIAGFAALAAWTDRRATVDGHGHRSRGHGDMPEPRERHEPDPEAGPDQESGRRHRRRVRMH